MSLMDMHHKIILHYHLIKMYYCIISYKQFKKIYGH